MGDILGGGSQQSNYEIRGTVESVDVNGRSVYLTNVSGSNSSMLSNSGSGSSVRVYYDDQTSVDYQGRSYRPQDLERGDQVSVRVDEQGNSLVAQSMTVTYNAGGVSSGSNYPSGSYPSDTYGGTVRGTVRYIDTSRRTIEVSRGSGSNMIVQYETNTPVYYNNQTYRAADLEVGDEIEVRSRDLGNNRFAATDITVIRNVSENGTWGGSNSSQQQMRMVRGTVRYVDTARRTIELESLTWRNGFQSNGNTNTNRVIISYDTNVGVDVSGQIQPVTGLERGDVIEVEVDGNSNSNASTYWARRIFLVRDVRNSNW